MSVVFPDATVEMKWSDKTVLYRMQSEDDLDLLSQNGGGCSVSHAFWVCGVAPPMEYFWVLTHLDRIKVILFTKAFRWLGKQHPMESKRPLRDVRGWGPYERGHTVSSSLYDWDVLHTNVETEARHAKQDLEYAQRQYEQYKKAALMNGPLGKDNPFKQEVDFWNRQVNVCRDIYQKRIDRTLIKKGAIFVYKNGRSRRKLVVMALSGVGVDYEGRHKYDIKLTEFATQHGSLQWVKN